MNIFDNFGSLVDLLQNSDSNDLDAISQQTGVDKGNLGKVIALGLPMILSAIKKNNQNPEGLDSFTKALNDHKENNDASSLGEYAKKADPNDGDKMLGHIFNDKSSIIDQIANQLGITPDAVKRVLILLAPVVIKMIATNMKQKNLDQDGVAKETDNMKNQIDDVFNNPGSVTANGNNGGLLGEIIGSVLGGSQMSSNPVNPVNPSTPETVQTNETQNSSGGLLGKLINMLK